MLYEVFLEKELVDLWDGDKSGSCMFSAKNDEEAKAFIATIVERMKRQYRKIEEPRNIYVQLFRRIQADGAYGVQREQVNLQGAEPLRGFRDIRRALEAFYPLSSSGRGSLTPTFNSFHEKKRKREKEELFASMLARVLIVTPSGGNWDPD